MILVMNCNFYLTAIAISKHKLLFRRQTVMNAIANTLVFLNYKQRKIRSAWLSAARNNHEICEYGVSDLLPSNSSCCGRKQRTAEPGGEGGRAALSSSLVLAKAQGPDQEGAGYQTLQQSIEILRKSGRVDSLLSRIAGRASSCGFGLYIDR